MLLETAVTVNRAALRWLKGYFRLSSAVGADGLVHLPRGAISSSFVVHIPPLFFVSYTLELETKTPRVSGLGGELLYTG